MWTVIILQLVILITLGLLFIIGPMLIIVGKLNRNRKQFRLGFKLFLIPFSIISCLLLHHLIWKLTIKPNKEDLIGLYQSTKSSVSDSRNFTLRLYENGGFEKSFTPNHGLCEKGKYSVYDNEIWFRCESHASVAKITKGIIDFKLKFIIGSNLNHEEDIIYEKVTD
mgnify:CR=1 FL=1